MPVSTATASAVHPPDQCDEITVQRTDTLSERFPTTLVATVALFVVAAFLLFQHGIERDSRFGLDESIYVNSARSLMDGISPWTPDHPPLGKSLIAVGIKFAGDNAWGWRIASAAAGSLMLAAIMLLTYVLSGSVEYTVAAGLLTLFDNFLFVLSRVARLDTFLMLFLFWGYLLFATAVFTQGGRRRQKACLLLSGILFGLAAACKWSAIFSIAAIMAFALITPSVRRRFGLPLLLPSLAALPVAAYAVTFAPRFRAEGLPFTLANLAAAQQQMLHFMMPITGNDFIGVPWYRWPLQIAPQRGQNFLVGNYVVTFGGIAALGVCAWRGMRKALAPELLLVALFLTHWLQWLIVPRRIVYYYYYYPCVLLLGVAIVLALARTERKELFGVRLHLVPVLAAMVVFLLCYPQMAGLGAPWDTLLGYWK